MTNVTTASSWVGETDLSIEVGTWETVISDKRRCEPGKLYHQDILDHRYHE
jgi:hypothetical protein